MMGAISGVSFFATFNPWTGCAKVSPACDTCAAKAWADRTGQKGLWNGELRRTGESHWLQPYRWSREAAIEGVRRRILCGSLCDVLDERAPAEWRERLWGVIANTLWLDWAIPTRRIHNLDRMLPPRGIWPMPNVIIDSLYCGLGPTAPIDEMPEMRQAG